MPLMSVTHRPSHEAPLEPPGLLVVSVPSRIDLAGNPVTMML